MELIRNLFFLHCRGFYYQTSTSNIFVIFMTKALYSLLDEMHQTHRSTTALFVKHMEQLYACEQLLYGEERLVLDQETCTPVAIAAMTNNKSVKELQLYCDCIGRDEFPMFARMLHRNTTLQILGFEGTFE